jgi:RHS repeat-associated protein
MLQTTSARVLLLLAAGTAAGGWFGCSSQDKAELPREVVATAQQALDPSACDPNAPFDPPQPAFTGYRIANGLAFSADGRTAYVSAKTTHSGTYAINVTQRDTTALPFAPLAPVAVLNTGYEDRSPWLSSDGLTLYLTTHSAATSWQRRIAVATRDVATAEFNAPQLLPSGINASGSNNQDAYFLSGQLYFASEFGGNSRNLYASPVSGTYGPPVDLGAVNAPDVDDQHPVLSPDGKTLYFASIRAGIGGDTNGDIWVSRRLQASDPFGPVTNLYGLNTSYDDFPVAVADNGCTLYFASTKESGHGPANARLYRATRGASTPALVTTTVKIIGSGSVTTAPFQCSSTCSAQGAPDTTVMVQSNGSAHWSGSCATQGGNPGSDAIVVFTKGGVCTVDFRSPGAGTTGSLCFSDGNCTSGTYCVFGQCSTGCDLDCTGKASGEANGCGGTCGGAGIACTADIQCAAGFYCTGGSCTPSWQRDLPIAAWYTADPAYVDEPPGGGPVSQWSDRSPNNRHAGQANPAGKPLYVPDGWSATRPSVRFSGGQLMSVPTWAGSPTGANQPFTVLAVMRSSAPQSPTPTQHPAVVAWWGEAGYVWAGLKIGDGVALPELFRTWSLGTSQIYTGPHDLGQNARHVVAWRYSPSNQTLQVSIDGTTTSSSSMPPIPALSSLPFIIGAKSTLPTGMFQGDIAELIVVGSTLTDVQLQQYTDYARSTWGDIPLQGSANPCIKDNTQPAVDGTRCDDGNATTYGDRCVSGACAGIVPPAGGPAGLSPTAWYHAGTPEVNITDGRVSVWFDRTSNHLDALQGFYNGRPTLAPLGWNGNKPTLSFNAGQLMRRDAWSGMPSGNDSELTVLAVMRSGAAQNAGVASWWSSSSNSQLIAQLASTSPGSTLHLLRKDDNNLAQNFTGTALDGGLHVVAWRYTPEVAKLTVDDATTVVTHPSSLANLTLTEMVIGATSGSGNGLFNGDISEIAIIPRSLTDAEITSFRSYAQAEWGGLTAPCQGNCTGNPGDPCVINANCLAGLSCISGVCVDGDETVDSIEYFIDLPRGTTRDAVALGSSGGQLVLADGTRVVASPAGFGSVSSVNTSATTTLGTDVDVLSIWSQAGVLLGSNAHVHGDAIAQENVTLGLGATIDGNLEYARLDPIQHLSWKIPFPTNQGAINVGAGQTQTVSASAFASISLATGGRLILDSPGVYTVDGSLTIAAGAVLEVDNRLGNIQLYVRDGLTFEGAILPRDPNRNNVLVGVGADGPIDLDAGFRGVLIAPRADVSLAAVSGHQGAVFARSILAEPGTIFSHGPLSPTEFCAASSPCSALCPCDAGGSCDDTGECSDDRVCSSGVCSCGCDGKPCGASDGCGGTCTCSQGKKGCSDNDGCGSGLVCWRSTCVRPTCMLNPILAGCGAPDSPCGEECTRSNSCDGDPDCGCTPNCEGKQCGDTDLSDGCGGRCLGVCSPIDEGCGADSDCGGGFICRQRRCRPSNPCLLPNLAPPDCGDSESLCGRCPLVPRGFPTERDCGTDPVTGDYRGACPAGEFCNLAGHCAELEETPPIMVPTPDGERPVEPQPSPVALGVGAIPGEFAVTESGSATYVIPIEIPPGRAGIQPNLVLAYSSSTANGTLGAGFSLDGLSSITRCSRTLAQDTYTKPVLGTPDDALCLDGQRLVQVEGTNEFRTSVDTFTKIVASYPESGSANPTAFTAHTKDGRVLFYGDVPSAQGALRIPYTEVHQGGFGGLPGGGDGGFGNIGAVGSGGTGGSSGTGGSGGTASGSAGPVIGTWLLSRVEDRVGNFMRITYRSLENAGNEFVTTTELVPDVITYTGHGSLDGDREVVFAYDSDREDQLFGWRPGGGGFSRSLRLNNIAVRAQGATVRTYALTYETVQHVSRLTRIQQCAGAGCPVCDPSTSGVCLPETVFEYYDEWGFEAPREFHPSYPGAYYNEGLNRYGLTRRVGRQDILDTFSVDTSVTTASPYWGLAAVGMSFIPYVGPFAASITNSLAEDQIDIEYRAWSFDIQSNRADGPFPTCGGEFPPTRQVIMGGTTTYLDVCPRYKETTEPVPMLAPNGQPLVDKQGNPYSVTAYVKRLYTPGVWMADVDGDGVQDKLFCDGESKLGYVLAKAYETGSSNPPTGAGHSEAIDIDAFGDLCKVACAPKLEPCFRCAAQTAVCTADRVFSTIFDVDGDGTANLVVNDRKLGWAALVYDQGVMSWRSDWFNALTIDANKTDYVEVLDVNGDGLRDLLALPAQASASTPPLVAFNTALGFSQLQLTPDGDATLGTAPRFKAFVTDLDHDGHDEIVEPMAVLATPNPEDVAPWRLRRITPDGRIVGESIESLRAGPGTMGDFDGDGNLDALTKLSTIVPIGNPSPYLFFKGSGRRQSLIKAVTDGRGHRIDVEYDGPGAIPLDERSETMSFAFDRTDPGNPSASLCGWPLRCPLASERPLVTAHTESHYLDGSFVAPMVDRSYAYAYSGPMADMGGYGSLGFLARQVKVRDANNEVVHNSSTLYVEPQKFTAIPYIYTIAGRPHVQTAYSPSTDAPLHESGWTQVVTRTEFDWREHTSSKGVPFPYLASRTLEVSDATDFGVPFYRIVETNDPPDPFGNITDQVVTAHDGSQWSPSAETSVQLHREFDPTPQQVDDWLVGLVGREVATSTGIDGLQRIRTRELEYYDNGLLHFVRREPGGAEELVRNTELIRDGFGNVRAVVSIDGSENVRESSTTYDERHLFPITQTNVGEGTSLTSEVRYDDRFGTVIAEADPNGIDATRSFDELGVMRRSTGPDGVGQFDYGPIAPYVTSDGMPIPAAYRITSSREGGEATEVDLNSFGNPVRSKRAGLRGELVYEEREYDVRQRLVRARRPHLDGDMSQGEVTYQYDNLDRLTAQFYPDGAQVLRDYAFAASLASEHVAWVEGHPEDGAVNIQRVVGPFGTKVVIGNRGGQPTRVIDADGSDTFYFYRAFDALRMIWRNSDDQVILVDQDAYGRRTSMNDASRGGADTIAYNGLDEVVETNDAAGRVVSYFYDDFGRLEHSEAPEGQITQWVYGDGSEPNSIGRLVETISPSGQHVTYGYEPPTSTRNRGLLTRIAEELIDPSALGGGTSRHFVTDYGYDNSSRLETIDYPSSFGVGLSVRYHFDDFGHVVKVSNEDEPTDVYWELVSADQGIRVHEERLGTAECGDTIGTTTQRDYYPTSGLLRKITTTCQGSSTLQDLHYVYEPGGNLYSRTNQLTGESETFGHDAVRRLTTVNGAERYSYDPSTGALASQAGMGTYAYEDDNPNWIKNVGANTYHHDAVGNIDSRSGPTVLGNAQTLEYTVFDLPKRVLGSGSVTAFQYDASESRVIKHDTVKGTTFYAGDLYQRVEELAVPGKERNWIYVGGRAVALVTNHDSVAGGSGSSTSRYLYDDHLGSIQTVAGGDGQVQAVRDYGPFGIQRAPSPMMDEVPLGFTGLEEDAELGLVNMNGRIYDPHLGQFLSADPVIQRPFGHGFNRFSYVHSSPLNFVDPSGFVPVPTDIIVSAAPQAGDMLMPPLLVTPQVGDMLMPALSVTPGAAAQAAAPASAAAVAPAGAGASAPAGAGVFSPADAAILGQTLSSVGTSLLNVVRCLFTPSQVHSTNISVTRSEVSSSGGPAPAGRSGPDIFSPRTEPGLKAAQAATPLPGQNPLVNTQLPSNDPNVRRYGDPSQLWGQKKTIKFIEELGREWANSNPGPTRLSPVLRVTSISKQGGGAFGQHLSHVTGLDIDIMVIVDEAQPLNWPTNSLPTNYSQSGTQSLVDAIHRVSGRDGGARVDQIFSSNDQALVNVSRDKIHYNHIHVRLFP